MPITKDRSDLPDGDDSQGFPPVAHPIIVQQLAEAWYDDYISGDDHTPTARWWASMSAMCSRSVAYQIWEAEAKRELNALIKAGASADGGIDLVPSAEISAAADRVVALAPTNPPNIADAWRMGLGSMVHKELQAQLAKVYPDAGIELRVTIDEVDGSARADAVITEPDREELRTSSDGDAIAVIPGRKIALELKTMNGFGFKLATTTFKGAPEGPKLTWITQGAMVAREVEADLLIIGVLSLECISPAIAASNHLDEIGRFAAEWHFTPEQYLPYAERETKRVKRILQILDEGDMPPRHHPEIPPRARITDPATGAWTMRDDDGNIVRTGKFWGCAYCWNQDRCIGDGE